MLEHIIIISLLCVGVFTLTREDCIFGFWQKVVKDQETLNYRTEMFNPVSECLVCMSSFWTCVYFAIELQLDWVVLFPYITTFFILLVSFVIGNKVLDKVVIFLYLGLVLKFMFSFWLYLDGILIMFCVSALNRMASVFVNR